ncbi:MAG: hypothetical protein LBB36_02285 [Fibromonadaceae bacterium]|jgi:hypothetical protein|nr:hypothetical protein [Fibromonadaceae bacterium]
MLFFASCEIYNKYKPTEFFKIEEKWLESYNTTTKEHFISSKRESFVLSNPPNDSSLLKKMVEEYNLRTISLDTMKKYKKFERVFYRETPCLTRHYEEGKPYPNKAPHWWDFPCKTLYDGYDPGQQTGYHRYKKENLMETEYYLYSRGFCSYSYNFGGAFGDTNGFRIIEIEDIDLFFEEGRKRLNK